MSPRISVPALVVALLLALTTLSACVAVPTSGQVEQVQNQRPACQDCVTVEVAPPAPGDDPQHVVEGYLRATSNYQPSYSVAKQFLTESAASSWSPEDGALIYSGAPATRGASVMLDGQLRGSLGPDRTYTARDSRLRVDFGVVQEDGEWRISRPPAGLMVADYAFGLFYRPYNLYFLGNNSTLVPDPIYLPNLRNQAQVASVLMKALLNGASSWLRPAVVSALPPNTTLSVDSVTVTDGVAVVPLSDTVLALNDQQRTQMAAQVVYTLKQAAGIQGVAFTVDQQPFRIPGSDPTTSALTLDAIPREVEPVPYVSGNQLYVVRQDRVSVIADSSGPAGLRPLPGPLGQGKVKIDSLAVSVSDTDLAVVTDGRTRVRTAATVTGEATTVMDGVTRLLRPQYSRDGELWVVGWYRGRQRLWVLAGGKRTEVLAPVLDDRATAFRVSPDGSRMALVRTVGGRREIGLARINRSERVTVDGWRPLNLTRSESPNISQVEDLAWLDATDLFVLGAATRDAVPTPYRISQDVSTVNVQGETIKWDAVGVATLLRSQTAVVLGRRGQAWRDDASQWVPFLDKVAAAAYPG